MLWGFTISHLLIAFVFTLWHYLLPEWEPSSFFIELLLILIPIALGEVIGWFIGRWFDDWRELLVDESVKYWQWCVLEKGLWAVFNGACVWIWHIMWS